MLRVRICWIMNIMKYAIKSNFKMHIKQEWCQNPELPSLTV